MWGTAGGFSGYGTQDGGGFMAGGQPAFNSPQPGTANAGAEKNKRARSSNIIPCTVASIMAATNQDGTYRIVDGRVELGQVVIIGLVKSVREFPSRIEYELDDSTGPILDIRQFSDGGDDSNEVRSKPYPENTYIRVFGHLRDLNDKRILAAFRIEPVLDMNALTTHILEVIYSRLHYIKGADVNMNEAGDTKSVLPGHSNAGNNGDFYNGLTGIQSQVHRMISGNTTEQGISMGQLITDCKGLSEKQLREAIEFLSGEGHIYSTIDDEHFRTTDS